MKRENKQGGRHFTEISSKGCEKQCEIMIFGDILKKENNEMDRIWLFMIILNRFNDSNENE